MLDDLAAIQSGITKSPPKGIELMHGSVHTGRPNVQAGYLDLRRGSRSYGSTEEQRARHLLQPGDVLCSKAATRTRWAGAGSGQMRFRGNSPEPRVRRPARSRPTRWPVPGVLRERTPGAGLLPVEGEADHEPCVHQQDAATSSAGADTLYREQREIARGSIGSSSDHDPARSELLSAWTRLSPPARRCSPKRSRNARQQDPTDASASELLELSGRSRRS